MDPPGIGEWVCARSLGFLAIFGPDSFEHFGGSPTSSGNGGPWLCVPLSRVVCLWHLIGSGSKRIGLRQNQLDSYGRFFYRSPPCSAGDSCASLPAANWPLPPHHVQASSCACPSRFE